MISLLFILLIPGILSFSSNSLFTGRRHGGFNSHLFKKVNHDNSSLADSVDENWLIQQLDHFDTNNTKTWKQRYFSNSAFFTNGSNVNLLYISGEQYASEWMVTRDAQVDYARQLNASIYALEHRFYGQSRPTIDTSIENLKYLSSRQAVEDIAEFIRQKNEEKGGNQRWIVVGGSYAGMLSAWSRLKHPNLISGSLASSAPIQAVMDFYGFMQAVEEHYKKIGGLCYEQIGNGIKEAQRLFQSAEGRENLTNIFKIDPPLSQYGDISDNDIQMFFNIVLVIFKESVQTNDPSPIEVCKQMTNESNPLEALQKLLLFPTPFSVNFTAVVDSLRGVDFEDDNVNWRIWTYQLCNELGTFETTNKGTNVFGQTIASNFYIDMCSDLFDIDADQIEKNVEETNEYYGGRDYFAGTNVVFTRGSEDPWSLLAMREDPKHWSVVLVEIEGGYHCSDLDSGCLSDPTCDENMTRIQRLVLRNMKRWIDPIFPVPDRVDITDNVGRNPHISDPFVALPPILPVSSESTNNSKRSIEIDQYSESSFSKVNTLTRTELMDNPPVTEAEGSNEMIGQDWIEQTWDHFNQNEEKTFKQKWLFNYKFGSQSGPNFLMIGDEGPARNKFLYNETSAMISHAKELGANAFLLEHRYYGESKLGTNDLQYLTSAQMLYDVATFIRTQQVKFNRTGPWITFGGSYAGSLSAWAREWFPDLILGAVSSSAPLQAKNDFYEYMEVVEYVIKRTSRKCHDRTGAAFDRIRFLSNNPEGRKIILEKFKLSSGWNPDEPVDPLDLSFVFGDLSGLFSSAVQYNSFNWTNTTEICAVMEDGKYDDPLDALRAVQELKMGENATTSSSYNKELQEMIEMKNYIDGHNSSAYNDTKLMSILWTWQTCNEFGYFQTTDYGRGIFGSAVPLNVFIIWCERVFGVGMDHVERGIERSNYLYGGRKRFNATNVIITNGDADPWHVLGIVERGNLDETVVPILIKDASHCADLRSVRDDDPPEVVEARKITLENIKKWLASPTNSTV